MIEKGKSGNSERYRIRILGRTKCPVGLGVSFLGFEQRDDLASMGFSNLSLKLTICMSRCRCSISIIFDLDDFDETQTVARWTRYLRRKSQRNIILPFADLDPCTSTRLFIEMYLHSTVSLYETWLEMYTWTPTRCYIHLYVCLRQLESAKVTLSR